MTNGGSFANCPGSAPAGWPADTGADASIAAEAAESFAAEAEEWLNTAAGLRTMAASEPDRRTMDMLRAAAAEADSRAQDWAAVARRFADLHSLHPPSVS